MKEFLHAVRAVLDVKLFEIGLTPVTVSTLIIIGLIVVGTMVVSRILRHTVTKVLHKTRGGAKSVGTITGLLHYLVLLSGFSIALSTAGIDLSALFAAGALFAVALGFAMQSITQNFVAGVILLSERTIKPGDILDVEGNIVRVNEMGIRAITAETRDGENLLIPNAVLIGSTVKNYTLTNSELRVHASVGVVYSADMALVRKTLQGVASKLKASWSGTSREPVVFMTEFGNNSVNFDVGIWIDDPWAIGPRSSELRESIWWALKEQGITIAFPQLDVHFDAPVAAGFARLKDGVA